MDHRVLNVHVPEVILHILDRLSSVQQVSRSRVFENVDVPLLQRGPAASPWRFISTFSISCDVGCPAFNGNGGPGALPLIRNQARTALTSVLSDLVWPAVAVLRALQRQAARSGIQIGHLEQPDFPRKRPAAIRNA